MYIPKGDTALGLAWVIAFIASLAVLFIGEVLGQTPCMLCWFQRAFMFPLVIILGLGLWWQDRRVGRYGIALAVGGAAAALWHMGLYVGLIPERIQPCTAIGPSCTDDDQLVFGIPIPLFGARCLRPDRSAVSLFTRGNTKMNRRALILSVLALGAAGFGGATWYSNRPSPIAEDGVAPDVAEALIRTYSPVLGPRERPSNHRRVLRPCL